MMQSDLLSVSLFKKSVVEYLPDYISVDNDVVLKTMQRALANNYNIYDSAIILSQELAQNKVSIKDVLDVFLTDLADFYVQNPSLKDPIIEQLLKLNHSVFLSKISDASDLQAAIQRSERKRLKELLLAHEEQQEEEDIRAAFQRIERKENKKQLQELEEAEDLMPTGSDFAAYSQIEEMNDENQFNKSAKSKNQIPWKFVIRVAAILILVLIPVSISIYFFNGGSGSVTNGKSKNNKEDNNVIYAETGDLTELKNLDIPSALFSLGSTILETDQQDMPNTLSVEGRAGSYLLSLDGKSKSIKQGEQGFGFSQEEEKISINLILFNNQIAYLDNKIESIESKYQELKLKKIKEKKNTLQSLIEVKEKCLLKKNELLALESTYEFKNNKLKLFKQEKINFKSIKVYSLSKGDIKKTYYLKIGNDYFDLSKSNGKLTKIVDSDILEQLDDI